MAQNDQKVSLGFEDELITEKYKNQINFTTNKIGGKPVSTAISGNTDLTPLAIALAKFLTQNAINSV